MPKRHDTRRLAMQLLYQMQVTGQDEPDAVVQMADDEHDPADVIEPAAALAQDAWQTRALCDTLMTELAPDWPAHRQPPVDNAILRLAYYELTTERAPVGVVINEAVELAKRYASERSPAFINGVLDKAARRLARQAQPDGESP